MCSRSAALVTLRVSATAMNALTLLRSMGRGLYIKSVYQGCERCIGQRVPQCGSVSPGLILSRGNRVLIRRPRCLDKPDRCAQDLLTLSSIIALMQGHTAPVMFDLASLLDEATALISITSSFDRQQGGFDAWNRESTGDVHALRARAERRVCASHTGGNRQGYIRRRAAGRDC